VRNLIRRTRWAVVCMALSALLLLPIRSAESATSGPCEDAMQLITTGAGLIAYGLTTGNQTLVSLGEGMVAEGQRLGSAYGCWPEQPEYPV